MAIYTIGTGGDFGTFEAYKTAGVSDGDTLKVISDFTDPGTTVFGNHINLTITSDLEVKPKITVEGSNSLFFGEAPSSIPLSGITIENVELICNNGAFNFGGLGFSGLTIRNNIITNNTISSLFAFVGDPSGTYISNTDIKGNLIKNEGASSQFFAFVFTSFQGGENGFSLYNNTIVNKANKSINFLRFVLEAGRDSINYYNNIFFDTGAVTGNIKIIDYTAGDAEVGVFSNNLLYSGTSGSVAWTSSPIESTNSLLNVDPEFLDTALYRIVKGSPCMNTGTNFLNIGWDQLTGIIAAPGKGRVISMPVDNTPGGPRREVDNGGGFDVASINDYPSGLYKKKPNTGTPNGYRAPNLR
jgi:hypothetical protein